MKVENIKKLGIMSDSHDNLPKIRRAVELFNRENVDFVIHAGDIVSPFTAREMKKLKCPFELVLGNNDGEHLGLFKVYDGHVHNPPFEIQMNDRKVLVIHDGTILERAIDFQDCDIIICGHNHIAEIRKTENGVTIINPGETGGWLHGKSTVAIYNFKTEECQIYEL